MWKERKKLGDEDHFFKTSFEESQFSPDITPLILASQKNQYEIVQLLLLRGEIIQKPHKFRCACQECTNKMKFDMLRSAKYRLNAYRGLASEAYISLSSKDPIFTAFELGAELKSLSRVEKYFKVRSSSVKFIIISVLTKNCMYKMWMCFYFSSLKKSMKTQIHCVFKSI